MATKGKVDIEIGVDDKASGKMKAIGGNADRMAANFAKAGAGMLAVGGAIVGGMAKMVNSYSTAGDEVAKMAIRTGISTEALSEMRHIAELTGTDLGSFEKAITRMQGTIVDAETGLSTATDALDRMGISVDDLKGLKPEEQFWMIADAIGAIEDPTARAATAQDVFGKSGTALLPIMAEEKTAIDAMKQSAKDMNIVFDQETADACAAFEDSKTKLTGALEGIKNAVAQAVMPAFQEFVEMLTEKLKPAMAWLDEHPEVAQAFLKFGVALVGAGGVCLAIAAVIKLINAAMIPAIIRATIAFIAMMAAAGPWGWAALAAGVGIAATAIAGLQATLGGFGIGEVSEAAGFRAGQEELQALIKERNRLNKKLAERFGELPAEEIAFIQAKIDDLNRQIHALQTAPSYQFGGVVPGRIGQPVPILAHAGERVIPAGRSLAPVININVGALMGDEIEARGFARLINKYIRAEGRLTVA